MGKRIDRWVLAGLVACGLYLFFLNAWGSVPLSCACAFACCLLGGRAKRLLPARRRATGAQISAFLSRMAAMSESQAQPELEALVRGRYPGEDYRLTPVLKHPEATLSCGDILNAWKTNRDASRLVIASTCPCEPRAAIYARELNDPRVAVVDSRALGRLLRRSGTVPAAPSPPRRTAAQRLQTLAARLASARVTPKNALLAAALLVLYLHNGRALYLFAALIMMFHLGAGIMGGRWRRRLFEGE